MLFQVSSERPEIPLLVSDIYLQRVEQSGCPVGESLATELCPNVRRTELTAGSGGSRVYIPSALFWPWLHCSRPWLHPRTVQPGPRALMHQLVQRHHSTVLMKLTSREPTQRLKSGTDVIIVVFSWENSAQKLMHFWILCMYSLKSQYEWLGLTLQCFREA